jgi:hypothetical protein
MSGRGALHDRAVTEAVSLPEELAVEDVVRVTVRSARDVRWGP